MRAARRARPHRQRDYKSVVKMMQSGCEITELARKMNCPAWVIREWVNHVASPRPAEGEQWPAKLPPKNDKRTTSSQDESIAAWVRGLA
jgi:hypothetical protein